MVSPERQGHALATVFSGMTIASVLGVPMSAWLAARWGWQPMMLIVATFGLLECALVAGFVHDKVEGTPLTLRTLMSVIKEKSLSFGIAVMVMEDRKSTRLNYSN